MGAIIESCCVNREKEETAVVKLSYIEEKILINNIMVTKLLPDLDNHVDPMTI